MSAPAPFIVVDASVWVSRLVQKERFHRVARAWMQARRLEGITFLSPALLLPEVAGALSRRTGDPALARQAVQDLQNLPGLLLVQMGRALVEDAARLSADLGLRGADAIYVAAAAQLDLPLVTLDSEQGRRATAVAVVQSPEDGI